MAHKDERLFVRISLDLPGHPKIVDAPAATKWLDVCGEIVSKKDLTDGVIRPSVALAEADVPQKHANDLIRRGRWHKPGHDCPKCDQPPAGHVVIHDFLEHQQSRDEVNESKRKKSQAGKKGAAKRWGDDTSHGTRHSTSHGTPHQNRIWQNDGKAIAESESESDAEKNNVVALSSQSSSATREVDDDGLTRIKKITRGNDDHARRTAAFILAKAPADVRNPTAYVLAAINEDPAAYRYRRGNPKKGEECPTHAGQWADACAGCAADRKAAGA